MSEDRVMSEDKVLPSDIFEYLNINGDDLLDPKLRDIVVKRYKAGARRGKRKSMHSEEHRVAYQKLMAPNSWPKENRKLIAIHS